MTRLKERLDRRIARMSSTEKIDREMAIILVAALAGGMAAASVILAVLGYLLTCGGGGSPSPGARSVWLPPSPSRIWPCTWAGMCSTPGTGGSLRRKTPALPSATCRGRTAMTEFEAAPVATVVERYRKNHGRETR